MAPFNMLGMSFLICPAIGCWPTSSPEVDAILKNEEEDDYSMFLQLFCQLDTKLARKLAKRGSR